MSQMQNKNSVANLNIEALAINFYKVWENQACEYVYSYTTTLADFNNTETFLNY